MNLANIGSIKKSRAALIKIVAEKSAIMEALPDLLPLPRAKLSSAILFPPVADTSATLAENGVPDNCRTTLELVQACWRERVSDDKGL